MNLKTLNLIWLLPVELLRYVPLVIRCSLAKRTLERRPESSPITNNISNVMDYNRVMSSKLAIFYCVALEFIYRIRPSAKGCALELASGPGHLTTEIAKAFDYEKVTGVDLAPNMVKVATENGESADTGRTAIRFQKGDVTNLSQFRAEEFSLTVFADAAHHLPSLDSVKMAFEEMDRVTDENGLIFFMDVARLPSEKLTSSFVKKAGADYVRKDMMHFYSDFNESMYAAWTLEDIGGCVPVDSARTWVQISPMGLTPLQLVIGVPVEQTELFLRKGFPWPKGQHFLDTEHWAEWIIMRTLLFFGKRRIIHKGQKRDKLSRKTHGDAGHQEVI